MRRTGNILLDQQPESPGGTPQAFDVLEVEAQTTSDGLLKWPEGLPIIDGVIICFDYSDMNSCQPVEGLLSQCCLHKACFSIFIFFVEHYRSTTVPVMVLGCKSELKHEVDAHDVVNMLGRYDTGLIEVSNANDGGKNKMKQSFDYLIKAILRQRGSLRQLLP